MADQITDPWNELTERGYKVKHTLGTGTFSKVREGYSDRLKKPVAIKMVNLKAAPEEIRQKLLPWEIEKLPFLRHENILKVYEIYQAKSGLVFIVMEAAEKLDMLRYIQRKGFLNEPDIRRWFHQICMALDYLHSRHIFHGNLKCENVLITRSNKILVSDCGFLRPKSRSKVVRVPNSNFFGKIEYAMPEVLKGLEYDPRLQDLWSLGVICYMMACGRIPFNPHNKKIMLRAQLKNFVVFPRKLDKLLSHKLKNFIRIQLQAQQEKRASILKILNHPFLQNSLVTTPGV